MSGALERLVAKPLTKRTPLDKSVIDAARWMQEPAAAELEALRARLERAEAVVREAQRLANTHEMTDSVWDDDFPVYCVKHVTSDYHRDVALDGLLEKLAAWNAAELSEPAAQPSEQGADVAGCAFCDYGTGQAPCPECGTLLPPSN